MPSKKAKDRKHTRKRAHSELNARRTEVSRKRRLDNKAKRDEIHAIDSGIKMTIINGVTYLRSSIVDGVPIEIEAVDGKIKSHSKTLAEIIPSSLPEDAIKTECDHETEELDDDIIEATIKFCKEPYEEDIELINGIYTVVRDK